MSAKAIYDLVHTLGSYMDSEGNKKYNTINAGTIFENDKGQLSVNLIAIPVGATEKRLWFKCFPRKKKNIDRLKPERETEKPMSLENKVPPKKFKIPFPTLKVDFRIPLNLKTLR